MPHYGLLREQQIGESAEDVRGASLYGRDDEKLGKIDDVIFDHSSGDIEYVVVDTGGWLRTKKFVVPADRLHLSSKHENDFASDLSKEQVESFTAYDENDVESEDKWANYEGRYRSKWESGPVMHREGTDRNITPTTQQMEGNQSSIRAAGISTGGPSRASLDENQAELEQADVRAAEEPTGRVVPAGVDTVIIDNSANGIGGRWDTFQARLRERRKEAVASCDTCSVGTASKKGSESADTLKRAV